MSEQDQDKEKNVCEPGYCLTHGVFEERRKNTQKDLEEYKVHTAALLTFKNIATGISIIAGMILTIGISYSYNSLQKSEAEMEIIKVQIAKLSADYARTDERYTAVTSQLSQLNDRVRQLVEILLENKKL